MYKILLQAAQSLDRPRDTRQLSSAKDHWLASAFVGALVCVGAVFLWIFAGDVSGWRDMQPALPVARADWRVLQAPEASAPPANWSTRRSLTDADIAKQVKEGSIEHLWLRYELSASALERLRAERAHHLIIGWLLGDVKIWAGSALVQEVPASNNSPLVFTLPRSFLDATDTVSVTIALKPRPDAKNIAPFSMGLKEGFATREAAARFENFFDFQSKSKSFALFLVYFVFSGIFFLLWNSNRVQREYLHLGVFAFLNCLPEILLSDTFVSYKLRGSSAMVFYTILLMAKAAAGLSLGFSFARTNLRAINAGVAVLLLAGVTMALALPVTALSALRQPLNQFIIPGVFFCGAIACLLQGYALRSKMADKTVPKRVVRLVTFACILVAMSALYYVQFNAKFDDYIVKQLLWGLPDLSFVLLLGSFALGDYRQQAQLVERIPVSQYHRRMPLPERLFGAVVMLDLKNSEGLYSYAAQEPGIDPIVPTVLSHIWAAISQSGGTILKAEGDEVVAFFDAAEVENPLQRAVETTDRVAAALKTVSEELCSRHGAAAIFELHFRASVALGEIRPIWMGSSTSRLPSWSQVGEDMIFVDAARLLEIEKQVAADAPASQVLLQSSALQRFALLPHGLQGQILFSQKRFLGKHDRIYLVEVYEAAAAASVARKVA